MEKIETKIEKLSGPTVVGKIELPVEKKKTAADKSDDNKRKRKRITKVDVERQARTAGGQRGDRGRGRRNEPKKEVSQADIQKEIKETLARLSGGKKSNAAKMRRAKRSAVAERAEQELQRQQEEAMTLQLTEFVTVAELANMMNANVNEVISACMTLASWCPSTNDWIQRPSPSSQKNSATKPTSSVLRCKRPSKLKRTAKRI